MNKKNDPFFCHESTIFTLDFKIEAISYVIHKAINIFGPNHPNALCNTIPQEKIKNVVESACYYKYYCELELKLDAYNATLTKVKDIYTLEEPYARHIDIGYELSFSQHQFLYQRVISTPITDFEKAVSEGDLDEAINVLYQLKNEPKQRIVGLFTEDLLSELSKTPNTYLEFHILNLSSELICPKERLCSFEIAKHVKFKDFFPFLSWVNFNRLALQRALTINKDKAESFDDLINNSLVSVFSYKSLTELLGIFFNSKQIPEAIELITHDLEDNDFLDLQTTPFIRSSDGTYYALFNTLSNSSFMLNALIGKEKRIFDTNLDDPLSATLKTSLVEHEFECVTDIKFSKPDGDIDLLAVKDNIVFILECKNSILPTSQFQLRTSFDYILKGIDQLTKIKKKFSTDNFIKDMNNRFGLNITKNMKFVYGIITCNRMFYGLQKNGFSVLPIHETLHFINEGTIVKRDIKNGNSTHETQLLRKKGRLLAPDFARYIEDQLIQKLQLSKSIKTKQFIELGHLRIFSDHWHIPIEIQKKD